eukprot:6213707-Pleurochrysis_carterae.AAC.2
MSRRLACDMVARGGLTQGMSARRRRSSGAAWGIGVRRCECAHRPPRVRRYAARGARPRARQTAPRRRRRPSRATSRGSSRAGSGG